MKIRKALLIIVCLASPVILISCATRPKTPGQKLDRAIDSTKETAEDIQDKYEDTKAAAKKKTDQARKDLSDKIKP